jgi:hypothetical protein
MNHDALTSLRRLEAGERDRALAHAYTLQKQDGFADTKRNRPERMRALIASAIRSHTRMMERIARALEAPSREQPLSAPERNAP